MRALFDVNVLLALFDPAHTLHARARSWWQANEQHGWASTPITENGFLRIISQPSYPQPVPLATALAAMKGWAGPPRHVRWSDDVSILDATIFDHGRLLGPKQLTDAYLLALAARNGGRFVTLDRRVPLAAVRKATAEHIVML